MKERHGPLRIFHKPLILFIALKAALPPMPCSGRDRRPQVWRQCQTGMLPTRSSSWNQYTAKFPRNPQKTPQNVKAILISHSVIKVTKS